MVTLNLHGDIGSGGISSDAVLAEVREALGGGAQAPELTVRLSSNGGDVFEGLAIYSLLRAYPGRVVVTVDGLAASAASLIAMAGSRVVMPEGSFMMIHSARSALAAGTAAELADRAELLRRVDATMVQIYARKSGRPAAEIALALEGEGTWYTAAEAVAAGLADELGEPLPVAARRDPARTGWPVPATLAASHHPQPKEFHLMPDDIGGAATVPDTSPPPAPEATAASEADIQARIDAAVAERIAHHADIRARVRKMGEPESLADHYIREGTPLEAIKDELLARASAKAAAVSPAGLRPSGIELGFSSEDPAVMRQCMAEALAHRRLGGQLSEGAAQYRSWRLHEILASLLEAGGHRVANPREPAAVIQAAVGLHTTSDFPKLLSDVAQRIFLPAYEAVPLTFRAIARRETFSDFRVRSIIKPLDFPGLDKVNEHGEYKFGTMTESAETAQLVPQGRKVGITRQAMVNDDLGAFAIGAESVAVASATRQNQLMWGIVNGNPTMADGSAFFSAAHNNLAASGAALGAAALAAGRGAMRVQKTADGRPAYIRPAVLAVPAALEDLAYTLMSDRYMVTAAGEAPSPMVRSLTIVADPHLDEGSETAWYLFGDPMSSPALLYAYLQGEEGPQVFTREVWDTDGVEIKVRLDFAAAAIDPRGAYKDPGA